jgi:hypothetical protein
MRNPLFDQASAPRTHAALVALIALTRVCCAPAHGAPPPHQNSAARPEAASPESPAATTSPARTPSAAAASAASATTPSAAAASAASATSPGAAASAASATSPGAGGCQSLARPLEARQADGSFLSKVDFCKAERLYACDKVKPFQVVGQEIDKVFAEIAKKNDELIMVLGLHAAGRYFVFDNDVPFLAFAKRVSAAKDPGMNKKVRIELDAQAFSNSVPLRPDLVPKAVLLKTVIACGLGPKDSMSCIYLPQAFALMHKKPSGDPEPGEMTRILEWCADGSVSISGDVDGISQSLWKGFDDLKGHRTLVFP